jgi:hypothetical protein
VPETTLTANANHINQKNVCTEAIGALGFEDKSNKQIATLRPTKTAMPIACKAIMVGNAQRDKDSRTQVATAVLSRKFSTSIIEFIPS